jgi:D-3-phosphoglycerate dehydrogenase
MNVKAADAFIENVEIKLDFPNNQSVSIPVKTEPLENVLNESDFVTLHVPAQKGGALLEKKNLLK